MERKDLFKREAFQPLHVRKRVPELRFGGEECIDVGVSSDSRHLQDQTSQIRREE